MNGTNSAARAHLGNCDKASGFQLQCPRGSYTPSYQKLYFRSLFVYYYFYLIWVLMTKRFMVFKKYKPVYIRRADGKYNILICSAVCVQQNQQHHTAHAHRVHLYNLIWASQRDYTWGLIVVEAHHDFTKHEILHEGLVKNTEWVFLLISAHMATNGFLTHFW